MTAARCIAAMHRAAGRELTDDEMIGVAERLERRVNRLRRERGAASDAELYREAAAELRQEHNLEQARARRSAAISVQRYAELNAFVGRFRDPAEGLQALLVGVEGRSAGGRFSVDYRGKAIAGEAVGGLIARLRAGAPNDRLLHLLRSGEMDADIAREMWAMPAGPAPAGGSVTGNEQARAIAAAIHDSQEALRLRQNRAGAWIEGMPGYVVRQSHDARLLQRAGFDAWRETILPLLDERTWERRQSRVDEVTQEGRDVRAALAALDDRHAVLTEAFNLAAGRMADMLDGNRRAAAQATALRGAAQVAAPPVDQAGTTRARAAGAAADAAADRQARADDLALAADHEMAQAAAEAADRYKADIAERMGNAAALRDKRDAVADEFRTSIRNAREAGDRAGVKRLRAQRDAALAEFKAAIGDETGAARDLRAERDDTAAEFRSAIGQARREGRINEAQADALDKLARRIERMSQTTDERRLQVLTERLRRDYDRVLSRLDASARAALDIERTIGPAMAQLNTLADERRRLLQRRAAADQAEQDLAGAGAVADREAFLRAVYDDILSGRVQQPDAAVDWIAGIGGQGNLALRVSRERVLHFRDADAWWGYHQQFGRGGLAGAVLHGLDRGAKNLALLETFGPNPQAQWDRLRANQRALHHGDPVAMRALGAQSLDNQFAWVTGEAQRVDSLGLAAFGAAVRGFNVVTKLGGMMLSSIADTATYAAEAKYQGRGLLTGYAEALTNLFRGRSSGEQRRIADQLGAGLEGLTGAIGARFGSADGPAGLMSATVQRFYALSGQSWWTDAHKTGAALMTARGWALDRGVAWAALDANERRLFNAYGIGARDWDLFRSLTPERANGREYLLPQQLRDAAHEQVEAYAGRALTPLEAQRMRDQVADRFQTLIADRGDYAVITPGAREQSMMYGGARPGTWMGEMLRLFWQFKAYPVSVLSKAVGRELHSAETAGHAAMGLASLFLQLTAMGYVAGAAKDLVKGREPRALDRWETYLAAMVQGGGAGIYGDFLFGEWNRFGRSYAETLVGPTFGGVLPDVGELWAKTIRGELKTADVVRFTAAQTPFANLFYVKPILDYAILYPLYDSLNPGYTRRIEQTLRKQNGQEFWLPPSNPARAYQ